MVKNWIVFLADRFIRSRREEKKNTTQKLSIAGLSAGVITLVAVMSVMNGLQIGFITDILEIESYHLRVKSGSYDTSLLSGISLIQSVTDFSDFQTLVRGRSSRLDPVLVRAIDSVNAQKDKGFIKQVNLTEGNFDIKGNRNAVIGHELSRFLNIKTGDTFSIISLTGESFSSLRPENRDFTVTGIFKSGYYDFDKGLIFISLEHEELFSAGYDNRYAGIKLKNSSRDLQAVSDISVILPGAEVISWRDYNRSFFSILRMEKITMMLLIALIFLVIGVNIYNSIKRAVAEKIEDIAVLYSLGASAGAVRKVFLIEGIIIGTAGGLIGIAGGLLIVININEIFVLAGILVSWLSLAAGYVTFAAGMTSGREFSLFPQEYFYLSEVPVEILLPELILIFAFAFLSSVISAFFASRKISVKNPAEYLRYE